MKLPTKLVGVKKINSRTARASFSAEELEQLARLIIRVEGTINPIILKRTSLESYEVVEGHFEYYAAVRAREISPLKGEMIQAIILEPEHEKPLLEQVALLRKNSSKKPELSQDDSDLKALFANLEKGLAVQVEQLRQDIRNQAVSLSEIANQIEHFGSKNELIEAIVKKVIEVMPKSTASPAKRKKSRDDLKPLKLNSASVEDLKAVFDIGPARASAIVEKRKEKIEQNGRGFTNLGELADVKGITKNTIQSNKWDEWFVID